MRYKHLICEAGDQHLVTTKKHMKNVINYIPKLQQTQDWQKLEESILSVSPFCQVCNVQHATTLHPLIYKSNFKFHAAETLPVCESCSNVLDRAIHEQYLDTDLNKLQEIKNKSLTILRDRVYSAYHEWYHAKHYLTEDEIKLIKSLQKFVMKRIASMKKTNVWYDNIHELKFTGQEILAIRGIVITAYHRKPFELENSEFGSENKYFFGFRKKVLDNDDNL
jgi:hypothetical protein